MFQASNTKCVWGNARRTKQGELYLLAPSREMSLVYAYSKCISKA